VAAKTGTLLMMCDHYALERGRATGEPGPCVPSDMVAGVKVGRLTDLYAAQAGNPPDQVITL